MTYATVYTRSGSYEGFEVSGHSGYGQEGNDVVCAAISALVINTVNSIEKFTGTKFSVEEDEEAGRIAVKILSKPDEGCELLIKSMLLGLEDVSKSHGHLMIKYKEV